MIKGYAYILSQFSREQEKKKADSCCRGVSSSSIQARRTLSQQMISVSKGPEKKETPIDVRPLPRSHPKAFTSTSLLLIGSN